MQVLHALRLIQLLVFLGLDAHAKRTALYFEVSSMVNE